MGAQAGFGGKRSKREVVDVIEPKAEDKSLDRLIGVRKQRMDRLERERREAREAWKARLAELHETARQWRAAKQAATDYWLDVKAGFLNMVITNRQYQQAKAMYEHMKEEAADCYLHCHEAIAACRAGRDAFFAAKLTVIQANKQQEKLSILRDEIRLLNKPPET
jgi:hypothetical protein